MTTTHEQHSRAVGRIVPPLPPFRTPVRGYAFAPRPPGDDPPVPGQAAVLVAEPGNPADDHAVAVWVGEGAQRWRIGYLDRDVAARVAPRLRDGLRVQARVDGWAREPEGRWRRPVVLLQPQPSPSDTPSQTSVPRAAAPAPRARAGVWGRPPGVARRTLGPARAAGDAGPRAARRRR